MGIAPPNFIASNALGQLKGYRQTAIAEQKLVTSIAERTKALGMAGDWGGRVSKLVASMVYPALDRQIAAFAKATEKQALKAWRFKPATRDGIAVEDWQTLTVRFDIN